MAFSDFRRSQIYVSSDCNSEKGKFDSFVKCLKEFAFVVDLGRNVSSRIIMRFHDDSFSSIRV